MDELELLERFCAEQPAPDPGRLQRARDKLTRQINARLARKSRQPRRRYAFAIVTAVAAGLTVTAIVMTGPAVSTGTVPTGTGHPPAISTEPVGRGSFSGRTVKLAVYVLRRAATAALAAPQPGRGQFIYTVTRQVPGTEGELIQTWQSANGELGAVRWTTCNIGRRLVNSCLLRLDNGRGAPIPADRTYAGLRTLPANPRSLLAYLERHSTCSGLPPGQAVYAEILMILDTTPVPPPRIGAALFDAAAAIPGITVIRNVKDAAGGRGTAIQMTFQTGRFKPTRNELIFDPGTYRYIGYQLITRDHGHEVLLTASELVSSHIVGFAPHNYTQGAGAAGTGSCIT